MEGQLGGAGRAGVRGYLETKGGGYVCFVLLCMKNGRFGWRYGSNESCPTTTEFGTTACFLTSPLRGHMYHRRMKQRCWRDMRYKPGEAYNPNRETFLFRAYTVAAQHCTAAHNKAPYRKLLSTFGGTEWAFRSMTSPRNMSNMSTVRG